MSPTIHAKIILVFAFLFVFFVYLLFKKHWDRGRGRDEGGYSLVGARAKPGTLVWARVAAVRSGHGKKHKQRRVRSFYRQHFIFKSIILLCS